MEKLLKSKKIYKKFYRSLDLLSLINFSLATKKINIFFPQGKIKEAELLCCYHRSTQENEVIEKLGGYGNLRSCENYIPVLCLLLGHLECFKIIYKNITYFFEEIIEFGSFACFKYWFKNQKDTMSLEQIDRIRRDIIGYDKSEMLKYLDKHVPFEYPQDICMSTGINCLQYFHEHGYPLLKKQILEYIEHDNVRCLKYCFDQENSVFSDLKYICIPFCEKDSLFCLRYLFNHPKYNESWGTINEAIKVCREFNARDCLEFLKRKKIRKIKNRNRTKNRKLRKQRENNL